jgi:hypothetical protein
MDKTPNSNDNDPVGHYLKLYELQKECLDRRIGIEWKVAIAFWTTTGAATGFLVQKIQIPCWSWWFFATIFLVFGPGWLGKVWYANRIDRRWMDVYRSNAEKTLGLRKDVIAYKKPRRLGFLCDGWPLTEILITALFLLASWYILTTTPVPQPRCP